MYGSSLRNLKMFRDLCGDEPMKNVIFITTGWKLCNDSGRSEIAIQKENQLATERLFWEPMLRRGAQMARFEDTKQSAVEIVMKLVPKRPIVLQIQHELVDERKDLIDTTAGATVNAEIKRLEAKYRQQLVEIQEEMAQALKSQDKEHQVALEETKAKIEYLRDEARHAQDILNYERRNADRRHELEIEDLRTALETAQQTMLNEKQQLQAEAAAQRYEDQMQFEQLVAQLQASMTKVREEDRRRIQAEILKVQKQKQKSGRVKTLLLSLLPAVGNVVLSALGFGVLGSASPFSGLL
jgi:DNA repair exonuclease SbcCD ATPase subunit